MERGQGRDFYGFSLLTRKSNAEMFAVPHLGHCYSVKRQITLISPSIHCLASAMCLFATSPLMSTRMTNDINTLQRALLCPYLLLFEAVKEDPLLCLHVGPPILAFLSAGVLAIGAPIPPPVWKQETPTNAPRGRGGGRGRGRKGPPPGRRGETRSRRANTGGGRSSHPTCSSSPARLRRSRPIPAWPR